LEKKEEVDNLKRDLADNQKQIAIITKSRLAKKFKDRAIQTELLEQPNNNINQKGKKVVKDYWKETYQEVMVELKQANYQLQAIIEQPLRN